MFRASGWSWRCSRRSPALVSEFTHHRVPTISPDHRRQTDFPSNSLHAGAFRINQGNNRGEGSAHPKISLSHSFTFSSSTYVKFHLFHLYQVFDYQCFPFSSYSTISTLS